MICQSRWLIVVSICSQELYQATGIEQILMNRPITYAADVIKCHDMEHWWALSTIDCYCWIVHVVSQSFHL